MVDTITFSEIDVACDIKQFLSMSKDISYSGDELKTFIFSCNDSDLLKVTKTIASPIKIVKAVKVDDDYIERNL